MGPTRALLAKFESERLTTQFSLSVGSEIGRGRPVYSKNLNGNGDEVGNNQKGTHNLKPNRNYWVGHHKKPYADLTAYWHPTWPTIDEHGSV